MFIAAVYPMVYSLPEVFIVVNECRIKIAQIIHFNMLFLMTNKRTVKNCITLQFYSLNLLLKAYIYIYTPCKTDIFNKFIHNIRIIDSKSNCLFFYSSYLRTNNSEIVK